MVGVSKQRNLKSGLKNRSWKLKDDLDLSGAEIFLLQSYLFTFQREIVFGAIINITKDLLTVKTKFFFTLLDGRRVL